MLKQLSTKVVDPLTQDIFKLSLISSKTLRKYIISLFQIVEEFIRREIVQNLCLILQELLFENRVHYVTVFCVGIANDTYHKTLIAVTCP